MKDQYFGDVNDFRKYGILRGLTRTARLSIGVFWMLTSGDDRSDGKFLGYLEKPSEYRHRDPELFDWMKQSVVPGGDRCVSQIEASGLLGNCAFHSDLLADQKEARNRYFTSGLDALRGRDLLFFDPDNGLEIKSVPLGKKNSCKYLFWDEVQVAFEADSSVLIYQHFSHENRERFLVRLAGELRRRTGAAVILFQTPHVLFLLACQKRHEAIFLAASRLIGNEWGRHIRVNAD